MVEPINPELQQGVFVRVDPSNAEAKGKEKHFGRGKIQRVMGNGKFLVKFLAGRKKYAEVDAKFLHPWKAKNQEADCVIKRIYADKSVAFYTGSVFSADFRDAKHYTKRGAGMVVTKFKGKYGDLEVVPYATLVEKTKKPVSELSMTERLEITNKILKLHEEIESWTGMIDEAKGEIEKCKKEIARFKQELGIK